MVQQEATQLVHLTAIIGFICELWLLIQRNLYRAEGITQQQHDHPVVHCLLVYMATIFKIDLTQPVSSQHQHLVANCGVFQMV